jgi:PIN domain
MVVRRCAGLNGFRQLAIDFRHITRCASLRWHHRDPFDRLLIAQALEADMTMVSRDAVFDRYGVRRIWQVSRHRLLRRVKCRSILRAYNPSRGNWDGQTTTG